MPPISGRGRQQNAICTDNDFENATRPAKKTTVFPLNAALGLACRLILVRHLSCQAMEPVMLQSTGPMQGRAFRDISAVILETRDATLRHHLEMLGLPILEDPTSPKQRSALRIRPLTTAPIQEEREQPTLFTSDIDTIGRRLECVRRGGAGLLTRPFPFDEVQRVIASLRRPTGANGRRVLIIEDDESMASTMGQVLRRAGYRAEHLPAADDMIDKLLEFRPDVLLLDLQLPGCNGAELALIARQLPGFSTMPILYVSGEHDPGSQIAALKCGADGFIVKPVRPRDLIGRIDAVVARLAELDRLVHFDALTGVHNSRAIRSEIHRAISVASRNRSNLTAAMIDVDHFKSINDTHGHLIGDRVLQRLGQTLLRNFRETDIIGRLGGEEFVVLMPGASLFDAVRLVDTVRASFPRSCQGLADTPPLRSVTFSAGVAAWRTSLSPEQLLDIADQALYRAKQSGRNRVESASDADSPTA